MFLPYRASVGVVGLACVVGTAWDANAETIQTALVKAYQNNPQLNAQRASARVADENVPQALSGYRPRVSVTGTVGEQYQDITTKANSLGVNTYQRSHATTTPYRGGATLSQAL